MPLRTLETLKKEILHREESLSLYKQKNALTKIMCYFIKYPLYLHKLGH